MRCDRLSSSICVVRSLCAAGVLVAAYLAERVRRFDVGDDGLNHAVFVERLIVPALIQATARLFLKAGIAIRIGTPRAACLK